MTEAMRAYLAGLQSALHLEASVRLAAARQWPGFREHEAAIARAMKVDADLSLADGYRQVVFAWCVEGDWALTPDGFVRK